MGNIDRINLRATREAKQTIEQAAAITGTTLSAFMLQHSYEKALAILEKRRKVQLIHNHVALSVEIEQ